MCVCVCVLSVQNVNTERAWPWLRLSNTAVLLTRREDSEVKLNPSSRRKSKLSLTEAWLLWHKAQGDGAAFRPQVLSVFKESTTACSIWLDGPRDGPSLIFLEGCSSSSVHFMKHSWFLRLSFLPPLIHNCYYFSKHTSFLPPQAHLSHEQGCTYRP